MGMSTATTTWIFNTYCFIWHVVTPLISPLTKEFGWRRTGYAGVFLASSSIILSAFSPSAEFLFFSYSLLSGIGTGLLFGISIIILPMYFDRRRGLANTFLTTGICLGPILIAPFIRHLLEFYSYKGGALIYGATLMNGFVAVSLFHPIEWHMKPRRKTDQPPKGLAPLIPQKGSSDGPQKPTNLQDVVPQHEGTKEEPNWVAIADQARVKRTRCGTGHRVSECSQESVISDMLSGNIVSVTNCAPPDSKEGYKGNGCLGVIKTLWMILVRVVRTVKSDVSIVRSLRALVIGLGNILITGSYFNFVMMVPFVMESEDHSLQDSAWCTSVMGICNLATRLIVSPLSDWKRFDKRLCIMFGCVVMGLAMLVFSLVTDLVWMTVALAAFGHGLGAAVTFYTLVMIQYLGIENLAAMVGVSALMQGCGFLIIGPTIGFIRDKSGSYAVSLWVLASMAFLAFILWLSMPAAVDYDNKNVQKGMPHDP
ncbi:monocarboxylate transporter 9-like [Panulirus ornatus]|uniref:monocarboxylate transporter 9-like n=1 Tax=Panulirus ornatus TaxID=150431 RepID=UPI003A835068